MGMLFCMEMKNLITFDNALGVARGLLGTPYTKYDCINFIKRIIRIAPGGTPGYQIAGTNSLWRSKDLLNKRQGITDARPGELVFKWKQQDTDKFPDGLGDFHHIGIVTNRRTVLHSSSVEKWAGYRYIDGVREKRAGYYPGGIGVIETDLDNRWKYAATHRLITPDGGGEDEMDVLYKARVVTESDKLNLRAGPSTSDKIIAKLERGEVVDVCKELSSGWKFIRCDEGIGYTSGQYLQAVDPEPAPDPEPEPKKVSTTLVNDSGVTITLLGNWQIAID